ncbi:leucine--tRNA ligase [Candidatus Alkanophaga liquidiphilum]|nr:Leucyl-tRNA synthetase [Candidatus Alkanophaga liquidiphilum]
MGIDAIEVEKKWQRRWQHHKIYEAHVRDDASKFYVNVAYPYPSGAMHVGHGRTYTVPDVIARFQRMKGRNVLFPMAFHVTGAPVIGIARRIAKNDPDAIRLYRDLYKVPEETLKKFSDPYEIVSYFSNEYKEVMDALGYSIDWRRRFTTVDQHYKKFIEWQFLKLRERGYVVKGEHPIRYCPSCKNPVGDHDLLAGEGASINEFVLLKFVLEGEELILPTATLRPETVFGVTNLWINDEASYVIAKVKRGSGEFERWLVSEPAAEKLKNQGYEVEVEGRVGGSDFVDRQALNVVDGRTVKILPASFVDPDFATGVVMSVPAHAPFDFAALRDLHRQGKYLNVLPIPIIEIEGYGEIPAETVVMRMGIENQNDKRLEDATTELYTAEFNKGRMKVDAMGLAGVSVKDARETVKETLLADGKAALMYEFSERPVVCRCNTPVVISVLKDQWFLDYSDEAWKDQVRACLSRMNVVPPEIFAEFKQVVEWLREWACTRRIGLGTNLPWDKEWIIEPLSDSTIYMAYYTISYKLRELRPEILEPEVFDYIFLGASLPEEKRKKLSNEELRLLDEMRREFLYWYPYDYRLSARDLVGNHLTFQLFHHVAIFPENLWPRGMVVFGMATLQGRKMSSSKGNVVLLKDAIEKYGADAVRMFLIGAAEPWQDFDWRDELVFSTRRQIERFLSFANEVIDMECAVDFRKSLKEAKREIELKSIDRWLLSKLQRHVKEVNEALENFQCRRALQHAYYEIDGDLRWYRKRTSIEREGAKWILKKLLHVWVRLLAPFIPHVCEEVWERWGFSEREGYVSLAPFPEVDETLVDKKAEAAEELIEWVCDDISEILRVINVKPQKIILYVTPEWKRRAFSKILNEVKAGKGLREVMPIVMRAEEMRLRGKETADFVRKAVELIKDKGMEKKDFFEIDEKKLFLEEKEFFEREFSCEFKIYEAEELEGLSGDERKKLDPQGKSKAAMPTRPAIFVVA